MGVQTNKIINANVYADGKSLLGMAEEINLPDVPYTMAEVKALGMFGQRQFISGLDKMDSGKIKWNSFYLDVYKKFANPFKAIKLQVRTSVDIYQGGNRVDQKPMITYLTIQPKKLPMGNFKQNDNVELEMDYSCTYIKQEYDGATVVEIDVDNNIFFVDGVDLLATYRSNLGI